MGNFTSTFDFKVDFDGDEITVVAKRLLNSHLKVIAPYTEADADGKMTFDLARSLEALEHCESVIKESIVSITGLVAEDGGPIDLETQLKTSYFMQLNMKIFMELVTSSFVKESDEKKLGDSSATSGQESPSTVPKVPAVALV